MVPPLEPPLDLPAAESPDQTVGDQKKGKAQSHNKWHAQRRMAMLAKYPELRQLMTQSALPLVYGLRPTAYGVGSLRPTE